jgi:LysR family transcriptional activator of glutamate synthase operon
MTINQIMLFLAIVKQKKFSRAANNMFISQSSLSKQIKAIETELDATLFSRDNHQVELTEAGKIFLPFAIKFLKDYSNMLYNLSLVSNAHQPIWTIKIGTLPVLGYSGLVNHLIGIELNNSQIHLDFVNREQSELLKMLDHNQIDFAIVRIEYLAPEHYDFIPLISEDLGVLCSSKSPIASKKTLALDDLANESFVLLNSTSGLHKLCIDAFRNAGFTPKVNYESSYHEVLLAIVNSSPNLTLLPKNLLNLKNSFKLKYIPLKEHITSTIALVSKKETKHNQKINTFQTLIKKYFKKSI